MKKEYGDMKKGKIFLEKEKNILLNTFFPRKKSKNRVFTQRYCFFYYLCLI